MLNPISFISKIFKSSNQNEIDKIKNLLKKVNNLEQEITSLKDVDFPKKTKKLRRLKWWLLEKRPSLTERLRATQLGMFSDPFA